jgi:hypothetical protein
MKLESIITHKNEKEQICLKRFCDLLKFILAFSIGEYFREKNEKEHNIARLNFFENIVKYETKYCHCIKSAIYDENIDLKQSGFILGFVNTAAELGIIENTEAKKIKTALFPSMSGLVAKRIRYDNDCISGFNKLLNFYQEMAQQKSD